MFWFQEKNYRFRRQERVFVGNTRWGHVLSILFLWGVFLSCLSTPSYAAEPTLVVEQETVMTETGQLPKFTVEREVSVWEKVSRQAKSWFGGETPISLTQEVTVELQSPRGEPVSISAQTVSLDVVEVQPDQAVLQNPGQYELVIRRGSEEKREQFLWGVLALNTPVSSVAPGETVALDLTVLNEFGTPDCSAPVWIHVTAPDGSKTELSTEGGQIQVSDTCSQYELTFVPDFSASFSSSQEGVHQLLIETALGEKHYRLERTLTVTSSPLVRVSRTTATRLYPLHLYPVGLTVQADHDWQGTVREPVSSELSLMWERQAWEKDIDWPALGDEFPESRWKQAPLPSRILQEEGKQVIEWDVTLKAGEALDLVYAYDPPDMSPALLELGPLQVGEWHESQVWQLAVDAVIVDSAVASTVGYHTNHQPNLVFTSDTTGYYFYVDTDLRCKYKKTTDKGLTWGTATNADSTAQQDCMSVGIWYDQWTPGDTTGTIIHIAMLDTGSSDVWYSRMDTTDDSISTTVAINGAQGGSFAVTENYAVITKGTDGSLYSAVNDNTDSYMIKCNATCTTAGNWSEAGTNPFDLTPDYVALMPLASGDILAVRWDVSADIIHSREYEDGASTWDAGGWVTVVSSADENQTFDSQYSFTQDMSTLDIYMALVDDSSSVGGANDDILAYSYNGSSWSALTAPVTNEGDGIISTGLARDENTDTLYLVYGSYRAINAGTPYVMFSTDNGTTWQGLYGPGHTTASAAIRGARLNHSSTERIGMAWNDNGFNRSMFVQVADLTPSQEQILPGFTGTQITTSTGGTNITLGGAWTLKRSASTADITQITATEVGTVTAASWLSNLDWYYETNNTCTYDGTETLFGTAASFDANEKATASGTLSVGTSQVCLYAILDIASGGLGQTLQLQIENPNRDLTVSAGIIPTEMRLASDSITNLNSPTQTSEAVIDNSVHGTASRHITNAPATVFTTDQIGYTVYVDTSGECVYKKTSDGGASWGAAVRVDSVNTADCASPGVWYDQWTPGDTTGTIIHIVSFDETTDDLYYTSLDTNGDTVATTISATGANQGGLLTFGTSIPWITKGTDGVLYMAVSNTSDSYMIQCSTTCGTASNWTESGTSPFTLTSDWVMLMPLASNNIMAIRWEFAGDDIDYQTYTAATSTWSGSWTTISTGSIFENATYDAGFAATVDTSNNDIYLAWIKNYEVLGANDIIQTAKYTGSWAATTEVVDTGDEEGIHDLSLQYDQLGDTVHVVWSQMDDRYSRKMMNVYTAASTDSMTTWSAETRLNTFAGDFTPMRGTISSTTRLYAYWLDYVPDDIYGNTVYDIPVSITVSGTAYQSDSASVLAECDGSTQNIKLYTEGKTYTTSCNDSTGEWTFSNVTSVEAGDVLIAWYDGMTPNGSVVTKALTTGSNISSLNLATDRVWLVNETTTGITHAQMGTYDSDTDADINYTVTGNNLVLASFHNLLIKTRTSNLGSLSYDPGGNLDTNGGWLYLQEDAVAELDGSSNTIGGVLWLETGSTMTIKGDTTIQADDPCVMTEGTATLTTSGTPTVYIEGYGNLGGGSTALTFYNLDLKSASGTITFASPVTVQNNLFVGDGTNALTVTNETNDATLDVGGDTTIRAQGTLVSSSTATQTFGGSWTNSGTFTKGTGTITFDASSGTETITPSSSAFHNLTINDGGGSGTYQLGGSIDIDNDFSLLGGTFDVSGSNHSITVGGDWNNDDTFVAGTGTVTLDGSGTLTLDTGCSDVTTCTSQDFYNLTINQPSAANTMSLVNSHLRVGNLLTVTRGILTQGSWNIRALGSTAVSVGVNGTWNNISTGDISLGGNVSNVGTVTFKANNTCGGANDIAVTATSGTPSWSGAGSYELRDVSVTSQDAAVAISVFSGTDGGSNTGSWTFYAGCTAGSLTSDIVDTDGVTIASPTVAMSNIAFTLVTQTSSGTFGSSAQKMRVENTTESAPWTLSIAADDGATAVWTTGVNTYDFNDPSSSATDGSDGDSVGGRLTINPSAGTSTPEGGCSNTGITLGSEFAFDEEGAVNAITLVSAGGSADTGCYWDITGIDLSQSVPAEQVNGSYSIDMTITAVAS